MYDHIVIFCTVPTKESALEISDTLISRKLAPCANIIENLTSLFMWENKLNREKELLMIIKSRASLFEKIEQAILSLHPYDVPEIIAMPIIKGHQPYLDWIEENTEE